CRAGTSSAFCFQEEDGIRDATVTGVRRVLFRSVMAYFAVPGMPTLDPMLEVARPTNPRVPASDSSHRSNVGEGEPTPFVAIRIVQTPVIGATTGLHDELSQIWTNASLSPFSGSGPLVALTWIAPSDEQT